MSTPYPESRLRGLRPWQPGQSGNPGGRRKGIVTLIREVLAGTELLGQQVPDGKTVEHILAESMIGHAIKGNSPYMQQIIDRLEGKATGDSDKEKQGAQSLVVILPAKELHADDQAEPRPTDDIPGVDG
jgi:hypothetical protein